MLWKLFIWKKKSHILQTILFFHGKFDAAKLNDFMSDPKWMIFLENGSHADTMVATFDW